MKKRVIIAGAIVVLVLIISVIVMCILKPLEYTMKHQFFKGAEKEVIEQITKTAELSKEHEGFNCTLKEYIYDGITVYAYFTVKNKDGSQEGLNFFDEVGRSSYTFSNANARYADWQPKVDDIYKKEKRIFFYLEGMGRVGDGYPAEREDLKNQLFLINCGGIESHGMVRDEARVLSFPLEITTKTYEVDIDGTKIIITPLQIAVSGEPRSALKEIKICFMDGSQKVALSNGEVFHDIMGAISSGEDENKKYSHYYFKTPMNLKEIKSIEGIMFNGETWSVEVSG